MTLVASALPQRPRSALPVMLGALVAAGIAIAAVLALLWAPATTTFAPLAQPGAAHWLGTDAAGRDVLMLLVPSALGSLLLALSGTLLALFVAIPAGTVLALRTTSTAAAIGPGFVIPTALLVGIVVSALSGLGNLTIILGVALPGLAYIASDLRAALVPLLVADYVTAARIAGLSPAATAQRHVLPRLLPLLAARAIDLLALAVLIELSLSFAGLGTLPPGLSLGLMLQEAQQYGLARPLLVIAPGLAALLLAIALKLAAALLRGPR